MADAAKVPPSRFQKPEGSIYATRSSRDGHVSKNTQTAFEEKLKEKVSTAVMYILVPSSTNFSLFSCDLLSSFTYPRFFLYPAAILSPRLFPPLFFTGREANYRG